MGNYGYIREHTLHTNSANNKGHRNSLKSGLECANRGVWSPGGPGAGSQIRWCEDSIFHTPGGVGGKASTLGRIKCRDSLDKADGANGNQILLISGLGVVFLRRLMLVGSAPGE